MSLLKKASIITTPTAYAEDYLYSIKPAIPFGEELVINGNFHNNVDSWSNGNSGVNTWVNGHLVCTGDGGSYAAAKQVIPAVENRKYIVTAQIARVSGSFQVGIEVNDGNGSGWNVIGSKTTSSEFVTVSEVITTNTGTTQLDLRATIFNTTVDNTNSLKLDNVSVKLLTDADFDFDRNSTGTRVNEDYLIEDVPYNLASYSENISVWDNFRVGVQLSNVINPFGSGYVYLVEDGTETDNHYRKKSYIYLDSSGTYTQSFFVKKNDDGVYPVLRTSGVGGDSFVTFNWDTETLVQGSDITSSKVEKYNNGWYRISMVFSNLATTDFIIGISNDVNDDLPTYTGSNKGFYVWGCQIVKGDQPKDYLKTTDRLDIPRIDYTNGEPSILLEPSRQNLVTHSEALTTYWTLQGASLIADNTAVNPTGNTFANKLNSTNTSTFRSITRNESTAWDSKTLTMSCFAKKITNDYIFFYNIGSVSGINGLWFNISNGTIGTNGAAWSNAKIENYGNGWYRCSAKITFGTSDNYLYINNSDGDNNTSSTVGSQTYIWGTQIEEGSYATSLIHTSGSAVTRSADAATNAGNSDLFNDSEGVLYAEISSLSLSGGDGYISITDGTASNRITLRNTSTLNNVVSQCVVGGVNQASMDFILQDRTLKNKIAFRYKANDFSLYVNGQEVLIDTSGTVPSGLKELSFNNGAGVGQWYGNAKMVAVFKEALTDLELEKLTGYNNHELYMNYYNRLSYLGLAEEYNVESDINNYIL
jgi:hypothetical protein